MRVELFLGEKSDPTNTDQWYLRLVFSNGEKFMVSEAYASHANAMRAYHDFENALDDMAEDPDTFMYMNDLTQNDGD